MPLSQLHNCDSSTPKLHCSNLLYNTHPLTIPTVTSTPSSSPLIHSPSPLPSPAIRPPNPSTQRSHAHRVNFTTSSSSISACTCNSSVATNAGVFVVADVFTFSDSDGREGTYDGVSCQRWGAGRCKTFGCRSICTRRVSQYSTGRCNGDTLYLLHSS